MYQVHGIDSIAEGTQGGDCNVLVESTINIFLAHP